MHSDEDLQQGITEWACIICGYRVRFEPDRMIKLNQGDRTAQHFGGTGGLRITEMQVE